MFLKDWGETTLWLSQKQHPSLETQLPVSSGCNIPCFWPTGRREGGWDIHTMYFLIRCHQRFANCSSCSTAITFSSVGSLDSDHGMIFNSGFPRLKEFWSFSESSWYVSRCITDCLLESTLKVYPYLSWPFCAICPQWHFLLLEILTSLDFCDTCHWTLPLPLWFFLFGLFFWLLLLSQLLNLSIPKVRPSLCVISSIPPVTGTRLILPPSSVAPAPGPGTSWLAVYSPDYPSGIWHPSCPQPPRFLSPEFFLVDWYISTFTVFFLPLSIHLR